jgi:hypothetical protein
MVLPRRAYAAPLASQKSEMPYSQATLVRYTEES